MGGLGELNHPFSSRHSADESERRRIKVQFQEEIVGDYYTDILVEDKIILELKSTHQIVDVHRAQTLNYLKATGLKLALILNFGKEKLEYERLVL